MRIGYAPAQAEVPTYSYGRRYVYSYSRVALGYLPTCAGGVCIFSTLELVLVLAIYDMAITIDRATAVLSSTEVSSSSGVLRSAANFVTVLRLAARTMQSIFLPRITLNPPCQRRLGPCGWQRRRTCRKVPPTLPLLGFHHQLGVVPCAVIEKTGDQSPGLENRRIILAALSTPAFFCAFTGVAPVVNAAAPAASSIAYLIDQANPGDTVVVPGVAQECFHA